MIDNEPMTYSTLHFINPLEFVQMPGDKDRDYYIEIHVR